MVVLVVYLLGGLCSCRITERFEELLGTLFVSEQRSMLVQLLPHRDSVYASSTHDKFDDTDDEFDEYFMFIYKYWCSFDVMLLVEIPYDWLILSKN